MNSSFDKNLCPSRSWSEKLKAKSFIYSIEILLAKLDKEIIYQENNSNDIQQPIIKENEIREEFIAKKEDKLETLAKNYMPSTIFNDHK